MEPKGKAMARKKVKLAWISNEAMRRTTLKKRRKGLMKKMKELSILCDVRACAIVYSPHEPQPEVWPSSPEVIRILSHFRAMPEMEQCKKMMNQETFLRQRVSKLHDQLRRHDRENRELESAAILRESMAGASLNNLRIEELAALAWVLDHKTKAVQGCIDNLRFAAALVGSVAGDVKHVADDCMAVMSAPQPQPLLPASVFRDNRLGPYYREATRWIGNGGEGGAATAGDDSYLQIAQLGGVGEGSGGVAAYIEQNHGNWDNFFPY